MNSAHAAIEWGSRDFSSVASSHRETVHSLEDDARKKSYGRPRLTVLADFAEPTRHAITLR